MTIALVIANDDCYGPKTRSNIETNDHSGFALLALVNIQLQIEDNPIKMRLLTFYPAVFVNFKLDYCK